MISYDTAKAIVDTMDAMKDIIDMAGTPEQIAVLIDKHTERLEELNARAEQELKSER